MPDTFARMRQLIGTSAEWAADDLVIGLGEIAVENTGSEIKIKVGDGASAFSALGYVVAGGPASGVLSGTYPDPGFAPSPDFAPDVTIISASNPLLHFKATGAPTNQKNWWWGITTPGEFVLARMNDAEDSALTTWLFQATGRVMIPTVPNGDNGNNVATTAFVKAQGYLTALTGLAAGGVLSGTYPNPGFTASPDFATDISIVAPVNPLLKFTATAGPLDHKKWWWGINTSGEFLLSRINDAESGGIVSWIFEDDGKLTLQPVALGDNGNNAATTAFVKGQAYAALASPDFTGDIQVIAPLNPVLRLTATGGAVNEHYWWTGLTSTGQMVVQRMNDAESGAIASWFFEKDGRFTSQGANFTAPFGYVTGTGGSITQAGGKTTAVTLNKLSGHITMDAASLAANTSVQFTFTNSFMASSDQLIVQHAGGGTFGAYTVTAAAGTGSGVVAIRNLTAAPLAEAIVLRFMLLKGALT